MNVDLELLERRITGILCKAVGQRLRSVVCTGIEGDLAAEVIADPEFDTVGGILLGFDDAKAFVSWDQNAGWSDQMTIGVWASTDEAFYADRIGWEDADLSPSPNWAPHIGAALRSLTILGWDQSPAAIAFNFETGVVVLAVGYGETGIRDGDDLFVRSRDDFFKLPSVDGIEVLWESMHQ